MAQPSCTVNTGTGDWTAPATWSCGLVPTNPINGGEFTLQTNFTPEAPVAMFIYNNAGRVEREFEITEWQNHFELSDLHPGSYRLKLAGPEGTIVKRILVR